MPLSAGTHLGSYEVISLLGAGGMGEVYQARDIKLGREVAIKILPEAFAKNPERLARFEREARLLASLNHPNIATLFGLEQSDGVVFLAMELAEGETLAEKLRRGPIPVEDTFPVFKQIAEAMEAAHEKGIIHRDLKPANIKVSSEGKVKVLDFGLAKALGGDPAKSGQSESPTITRDATETGVILGTAAYMSPEQARGKTVDKRTDIWAFGCCLYETLTGLNPFGGETVTDIFAAIVNKEPDYGALPATTPTKVTEVLRRCLRKDWRRRLRDVGDARIELEDALSEPALAASEIVGKRLPSYWQRTIPWLAAALAATVAIWSLMRASPSSAPPLTRLTLSTPPLPGIQGYPESAVAISPDGTRLVFNALQSGTVKLFLRGLDQLDARALDGTDGASSPFFSPNRDWIGFFADGKLKKLPVAGGVPVTLCESDRYDWGASWGPDDRIYFYSHKTGRVHWVSAAGGTPQPVTTRREDERHRWPQVLPGGKAVLVSSVLGGSWDRGTIGLASLETGEYQPLIEQEGHYARYVPTGHIVYLREGRLLAVPFDVGRLEVIGAPVPVVDGVLGNVGSGRATYSFSDNGTLVYVPGSGMPKTKLVWVDRKGTPDPVTDERHPYFFPRVSPDGGRIALSIYRDANTDIWVYDVRRGALSRLTTSPSDEENSLWTPDGRRLAFQSTRDGLRNLYWTSADGSAPTERLLESEERHYPQSWSPDGQVFAYVTRGGPGRGDLWVLPIEGERTPQPFLATPFREAAADFSPDGRWIAYTSDESGRPEVYVRPYPGPGGKWQISTEGGHEPLWGPDGREIFYRSHFSTERYEMMVTAVQLTPEFSPDKPRLLFEDRYERDPTDHSRNYDIAPDGKRFVMIQPAEESPSTEIVVVLNWFEELKRLAPREP